MKTKAIGLLSCLVVCSGCGESPTRETALATRHRLTHAWRPSLPSPDAVSNLLPLQGMVAKNEDGLLGDGRWRFNGLSLEEGPAVYASLSAMNTTYGFPRKVSLQTDGDVADLFFRITGRRYPNARSRLSRAYLESRTSEEDERPSLYLGKDPDPAREDLLGPIRHLQRE